MDAQQSRKGSRQYRLQRQWQPTYKQSHRNATGHRMSVTRQPGARYAFNKVAGNRLHKQVSGIPIDGIKGVNSDICDDRTIGCGL